MAEAEEADPLLGKVLNERFTILQPLGVGGMGRVYKARQAPLDRVVALKVLNPAYAGNKDPGFQRRFFLEASLTSKLHHPNTITIHDYGCTEDGIFYIAMEYVEGQTLAQLITHSGALPVRRAVRIAQQICRSIREAHRMGIVHRDVKPANVMILNEETERDVVKVLDFGLVKSFLPESSPSPEETDLTQAGVLLGSPLYMAPEQARNQADPRSDIYSLGVVLYQMLAGKPPFVGKESIEVIVKHLREPVPSLRAAAPTVPPELEAVVMRCLEKDPDKRYPNMDGLLEAMRAAATDAGLSGAFSSARSQLVSGARVAPLDSEVTRAASQGLRHRKLLWAGILAAALLLGGALALLLSKGPPKPPPPPAPMALPPVALTPPSPAKAMTKIPVRFEIRSVPPGARVGYLGQDLGPCPVTLELPAPSAADAPPEFTFSLEGYQNLSLKVEGPGPVVQVEAKLEKRSVSKPRPAPKKLPEGYKEDPYQ